MSCSFAIWKCVLFVYLFFYLYVFEPIFALSVKWLKGKNILDHPREELLKLPRFESLTKEFLKTGGLISVPSDR